MLQRVFEQYRGFLRTLKIVYVLNNLLNYRYLRHNRQYYQHLGVRKSVLAPIGSADFAHAPTDDLPWLDQPDALTRLENHPAFKDLPEDWQQKARQFVQEGYCVLEQFYTSEQTEALSAEIDTLLNTGKVRFNYTRRKIFNLHEKSALADKDFFRHPKLLRLLSFLLGKPVIPFQSLAFVQGSEQRAHSDSIHMSTYPPGYLIATWTALEDCTEDNGPLFYYPASHRLPYITTADYPSGNTRFTIGRDSNKRYEDYIEALINRLHLQKRLYLARRGDVLIWHANLLHGGAPITRPGATRRSLVCHYFAKGVFCYHEISQRPAIIKA
ncbi:MAG: phytanoyl-CoA dioxygenase family protein [Saprospiraceae bacterium]|nr:phytanoyl-CoA dioxygenase family protein [Saprospiraceae bacterium]MDW8482747.1 phytanoyl-CoA dioxygenase family protein [Saprospiraceae bacterium]